MAPYNATDPLVLFTVTDRKANRPGVRVATQVFSGDRMNDRAARVRADYVAGLFAAGWTRVSPETDTDDLYVCVYAHPDRPRTRRMVSCRPATPDERMQYAAGDVDRVCRWSGGPNCPH